MTEPREHEHRDNEDREHDHREHDHRDREHGEHRDHAHGEHGEHEHREHHHHSLEEVLEEKPALTAILFDLRSVIGLLFVVYGLVLTILGFIGETPDELAKAGGLALNLWVGLAMLVGGIIFFVWAFTKPPKPVTPDEMAEIEEGGPMHMGGH